MLIRNLHIYDFKFENNASFIFYFILSYLYVPAKVVRSSWKLVRLLGLVVLCYNRYKFLIKSFFYVISTDEKSIIIWVNNGYIKL